MSDRTSLQQHLPYYHRRCIVYRTPQTQLEWKMNHLWFCTYLFTRAKVFLGVLTCKRQTQARRQGGAKGGTAPSERICAPSVFLTKLNVFESESEIGKNSANTKGIARFRERQQLQAITDCINPKPPPAQPDL